MSYRKEETGKCKIYYGARKDNISCSEMYMTMSGAAATLMDPTPPETVVGISIAPKDKNPITRLEEGTLVVKDETGTIIETVTGVKGNSGSLVFSLATGFEPSDPVTLCFGNVRGIDITGNSFENSFECPNQ